MSSSSAADRSARSPLAREEIERRAAEALERAPGWLWDRELPIPVEEIAESCFGLLVRDVPPEELAALPRAPTLDEGETLSGLLLASRSEIWVNAEEAREWPGRRRFTICHELGHWQLHRTGQQALFCRSTTVAPEDTAPEPATTRPPRPITEEEADAFAAELLMPAHLVRAHRPRDRDEDEACRLMCHLFGASEKAIRRRLEDVTPPPA